VRRLEKQIYPDLPPALLLGLDGLQPGPTFVMRKDRGKPSSTETLTSSYSAESVIKFSNHGPKIYLAMSLNSTTVRPLTAEL
jgi:hypothetical protein